MAPVGRPNKTWQEPGSAGMIILEGNSPDVQESDKWMAIERRT